MQDSTDAKHDNGRPGDASCFSDRYNMDHKDRGIAIIINNVNFHKRTQMSTRSGSDVDTRNMYELLSAMGFAEIRTFRDLTVGKMKQQMNLVSREDHTNNDCFVCVILSHGEEGYVYGHDDKISLDDLIRPIKGNNCKSLAGKPKIFLIQVIIDER